jgi:hypothetical protein
MTGMMIFLYVAIGVGCGLIRLSAVAVGIVAVIPAVVGAYAASGEGMMAVLVAFLGALLVIEGVYFLTMLLTTKLWPETPIAQDADAAQQASDLRLHRKPHMPEKP